MWRVLERCDVVLVVADVRCPLLHVSEAMVRAVLVGDAPGDGRARSVVICLNKSDLVPPALVEEWRRYYERCFASVLAPAPVAQAPTPEGSTADASEDAPPRSRRGELTVVAVSAHPDRVAGADAAARQQAPGADGSAVAAGSGAEAPHPFYSQHSCVRARLAKPRRAMPAPTADPALVALMHACGCEPAPGGGRGGGGGGADEGRAHVAGMPADAVCTDSRLPALARPGPPPRARAQECSPLGAAERAAGSGKEGRGDGGWGGDGDVGAGGDGDGSESSGLLDEDSSEGEGSDSELLALARGRGQGRLLAARGSGISGGSGDESGDESGDAGGGSAGDEACDAKAKGGGGGAAASGAGGSPLVVGFIGQPNAGKTSLMNRLVGAKVASESRSAGHTKYLQTMPLRAFRAAGAAGAARAVMACDCPGLVHPAPAHGAGALPRPLQELFGMYPLPQVREPFSAIRVLAQAVCLPRLYKLRPLDDAYEPLSVEQGGNGGDCGDGGGGGGGDGDGDGTVSRLEASMARVSASLSELPPHAEWRRLGRELREGFEALWLRQHGRLRALLRRAGAGAEARWLRGAGPATRLFQLLQLAVQSGPLAGARPAYLKRATGVQAAAVMRLVEAVGQLECSLRGAGGTGGAGGAGGAGGVAFSDKQRAALAAWRAAAAKAGAVAVAAAAVAAEPRAVAGAAAGASAGAGADMRMDPQLWSPRSICAALALQRGLLMARTGLPDVHSAGLAILRDCQDGLLPFALVPPPLPNAPTPSPALAPGQKND
eukprot:g7781.t1